MSKFVAGDVVTDSAGKTGVFYQILEVHSNQNPGNWYTVRTVYGGRFNDQYPLESEVYYKFVRHAALPTA